MEEAGFKVMERCAFGEALFSKSAAGFSKLPAEPNSRLTTSLFRVVPFSGLPSHSLWPLLVGCFVASFVAYTPHASSISLDATAVAAVVVVGLCSFCIGTDDKHRLPSQ
jgi:hypothetical protein